MAAGRTFTLTVTSGIVCNGTVQFTNGADVTGTEPVSVAVGDFNNDGNQDVAIANAGLDMVSIRLGDGLGGFQRRLDCQRWRQPYRSQRRRLWGNNDGKQDFASSKLFGKYRCPFAWETAPAVLPVPPRSVLALILFSWR